MLFLSFVLGLVLLFQINLCHDAFQYYGYAVSVVLDGDLDLYDEIYLHNADRDYNPFAWNSGRYIGTAIFEAPFVLAGQAIVRAMNGGDAWEMPNGYSDIHRFLACAASMLFGVAGVGLTYRFCRHWFARDVSLMAVLAVSWATVLPFYLYVWPGWSHSFAFFLTAAFLVFWRETRVEGGRTRLQWVALGLLGGWLLLVRPPDALVMLLPLTDGWGVRCGADDAVPCGDRVRRRWIAWLLYGATALLVFSPQFSLWKAISGHWIASPYVEVGDHWNWWQPGIGGILFSVPRHGLITWTPLVLPALAGWFFVWRRDRWMGAMGALVVGATVYVYACWSIWWTGVGFGNRFFVGLTPLLALGLAALLEPLRRRLPIPVMAGALTVAAAWNLLLIGAYLLRLVPLGIPDPARATTAPLSLGAMAQAPMRALSEPWPYSPIGVWFDRSFFAGRFAEAWRFGDWNTIAVVGALFAGVCFVGWWVIGISVGSRGENRTGRPVLPTVVGLAAAALVLVHGVIAWAGHRTEVCRPPVRVSGLMQEAGPLLEDPVWRISHPVAVTSVDLLTYLIYGHELEQGAEVAEVTVEDRDGRVFRAVLHAGVETAETSAFRRESVELVKHRVPRDRVVRASSSHSYSSRRYPLLVFRSSVVLPEPSIVRSVAVSYRATKGQLVVTDVFLGDFEERGW